MKKVIEALKMLIKSTDKALLADIQHHKKNSSNMTIEEHIYTGQRSAMLNGQKRALKATLNMVNFPEDIEDEMKRF